jgi:serine/threonine-protein kinase
MSEERATLSKRLLTEARATSRLRHPAIVEVFDCDTLAPGGAFIAMEYLQGEPAGDWLARMGGLAGHPRVVAALVGVVADALGHAHEVGIIHRDIKPNNLILIPDPADRTRFSVKVLDFGIAKMLNELPLVVTRGDRVLGTPFYMAPEQWVGSGFTDVRADIYSLGCVLYEALANRPPFVRDDGLAMMHAHLEAPPPRLRDLLPDAPAELEALIERMLAKDPEHRPQKMGDVVSALEAFLGRDRTKFGELLVAPGAFPIASGSGHKAEPTRLGLGGGASDEARTTARLEPLPPRRRVWLGAGLAVATVVLLVGGALLARGGGKPAPQAAPPAPVRANVSSPAPTAPPVAPVEAAPAPAATAGPAPAPASEPREARPARAKPRPRNVYRPVGD